MRGEHEQWPTKPMCSSVMKDGGSLNHTSRTESLRARRNGLEKPGSGTETTKDGYRNSIRMLTMDSGRETSLLL